MRLRFFLVVMLLCITPISLAATLGFSLDNDFFVGKDSHYTNGMRLAYLSSPRATGENDCAYPTGLCDLPGMGGAQHQQAWSIAIQQMMITPEDISTTQPDFGDLPYVGFTQLDLGFYNWDNDLLTGYGVRIGVIGKNSGAEQTQKVVHSMIGSKQPKGWDNQLGPATVGGVYAFQSRRLAGAHGDDGYGWSGHLAYGVDANNFIASGLVAGFISYGHDMTVRFIPDFTGMSTSGAMVGRDINGSPTGWSVFAGLLGEYEAYNYIDRHAPAAYHLDAQKWIGNLMIGFSHRWHALQLVFTLRSSNSTLKHNSDPLSFGDLTLLWDIP